MIDNLPTVTIILSRKMWFRVDTLFSDTVQLRYKLTQLISFQVLK